MKSIYLDQNVYGHLLDSGDWKAHPVGRVLHEHATSAGVWVSPTHVIELSQNSDSGRRTRLAQLMLELCGASRMWPGSDFSLIESFGAFLNSYVPTAFNPGPFFNRYKDDASRIYLGYLGLLAAVEDVQLGPGQEQVRRSKRESLLLHSRVAADPKGQVEKIIQAAKQMAITADLDPMDFSAITDQDLEAEIAACRVKAAAVPKADLRTALKKLEKNRAHVAAVYGAVDIGHALTGVFLLPCDLEFTFDTPALIAGWSTIQAATGAPSLSQEIASTEPTRARGDRSVVVAVLNAAIRAAAQAGLAQASIGYYALLREIATCMNKGELPTDGAALDVDHATAALGYDVFVCRDQKLQTNVSTFLRTLSATGHTAVYSGKQLRKALKP